MPINLSKGQKVDLTKGNPGLKNIMVGLGWDVNAFDTGADFDLDAAAVMLVLSTMAKGGEAIVSRGELVEVGGSFRIPSVMALSGADLVEIGATNKTHLKDYEEAITENTRALMKVHTSNYRIMGFTESISVAELVELGKKYDLPVIEDLGSGVFIDLSKYGLEYEPTVLASIHRGADIVTFSGDKMLGGAQAGIIVGKKKYISAMKKNQLTRALRVDKLTICALEATLRMYLDEEEAGLTRILTNATVEYAHGQMGERQLETIMSGFINKEIDVLVSTTIIETGLDIPNVNTMIIQDAQLFGLSQLYQLRGRVGRSNRTAYAFLMYRRNSILKEEAEKRLKAIREFTDLGSGFKIAMRDLEIRGAGNLLGAEQSGHMESVGYDLYCKMLNEAVLTMKGEQQEVDTFTTSIDLSIDAYIPETYIKSESEKLSWYKRIATIETQEESEDMIEEMTDRYGDTPAPFIRLMDVALLREEAHQAWRRSIEQKGSKILFSMNPRAKVRVEEIDGFLKQYRNKMKIKPEANPVFVFESTGIPKKDLLAKVREIIGEIQKLQDKS